MTRKRTTWHMDLRQLTVCYIRAVWVDQYARCNFFVCGPKFITWTENFGEIIPTSPISPEVIDVPTLNFKPSFKFSRLIFLVGPPSQFGCALGNLGQSLARVKISGRSPLKGENTVSRKMRTTVGQYSRQQLFRLWTKVQKRF